MSIRHRKATPIRGRYESEGSKSNKRNLQIPQCTSPIYHIAPFCNRMCTYMHNSATKWCIVGGWFVWCIMGIVRCVCWVSMLFGLLLKNMDYFFLLIFEYHPRRIKYERVVKCVISIILLFILIRWVFFYVAYWIYVCITPHWPARHIHCWLRILRLQTANGQRPGSVMFAFHKAIFSLVL